MKPHIRKLHGRWVAYHHGSLFPITSSKSFRILVDVLRRKHALDGML